MSSEHAFQAAGAIGIVAAIVHGLLVRHEFPGPMAASSDLPGHLRPFLLPASAFSWLAAGAALFISTLIASHQAQVAVSLLAGAIYGYGILLSLLASGGPHPGWLMLGLVVGLIVLGWSIPPKDETAESYFCDCEEAPVRRLTIPVLAAIGGR